MTATIKIDSIDSKYIQLNIIEQQIEEVVESVPFTRQERILFDSFYFERLLSCSGSSYP